MYASFPFRYTRRRFRDVDDGAAVVDLVVSPSPVFAGSAFAFAFPLPLLLFIVVAGGGTYSDGRLTCRPDFVCVAVAVGVGSVSSSVLESAALITSSPSLSLPRRRLVTFCRVLFGAVLRFRELGVGFWGLGDDPFVGVIVVAVAVAAAGAGAGAAAGAGATFAGFMFTCGCIGI